MYKTLLTIMPPWGRPTLPIGLGYLSRFLSEHGHDHDVDDMNMEIYHRVREDQRDLWLPERGGDWADPERFARLQEELEPHIQWVVDRLDQSEAEVIGFSVNQSNNRFSVEVAKRLRERDAGRILLFGGLSIYLIGERLYIPDGLIDLYVMGEGEVTLLRILERLRDGEPIHGITGTLSEPWRLEYEPRPMLNMEQHPWPTYDKFQVARYPGAGEPFPITLSRGCVCACSFCGDFPFWGKFRSRDGAHVVDEIRFQVETNGIRVFEFNDLAINGNRNALERLCDGIIAEGLEIEWSSYAYIAKMSDEFVEKLVKSGCVMLRFGMESASNSVLKRMRKPHRAERAAEMLAKLTAAGIHCNIGLMAGFPDESDAELDETIAFLMKNQQNINEVDSVSVFYIKPLSRVEQHPEEFGVTLPDDDSIRWNRWVGRDGSTYEKRVARARRLLGAIRETSIALQGKNIFGL